MGQIQNICVLLKNAADGLFLVVRRTVSRKHFYFFVCPRITPTVLDRFQPNWVYKVRYSFFIPIYYLETLFFSIFDLGVINFNLAMYLKSFACYFYWNVLTYYWNKSPLFSINFLLPTPKPVLIMYLIKSTPIEKLHFCHGLFVHSWNESNTKAARLHCF